MQTLGELHVSAHDLECGERLEHATAAAASAMTIQTFRFMEGPPGAGRGPANAS
jgi:hypothetical protein